jgi:SNF2 family DNA or RNA helicase
MNAKVIPFPTPAGPPPPPVQAPRAILQASSHARGARPYTFSGVIDEYHAPGVVFRNGDTRCAADAAWLVGAVLGAPRGTPPNWPGVPGARERAMAYGQAWTTPDEKKLRQYQCDGAAFLAERDYAMLWDAPGIGKSSQALIAAEARLSLASIPSPTTPVVLIVCPALAKRHWRREITRWTGHDSTILDGLRPEEFEPTRYVIANYDILHGAQRKDPAGVVFNREDLPGWAPTLRDLHFPIVIFDEAHILRGRKSRRTEACRELCLRTPVVWGLTGTPMPNYVRDLWSTLDLITSGLFGKYYSFARAYADGHDGQYGFEDRGQSRVEELRGRLTFFALGRNKDSVGLELPPMLREVYKIDVEVSAPTVHEGHKALDKGAAVASAFRSTARAKRSVVIAQAVEALEARQKVIVFLYMREQCDAVAKSVKDKWDGLVIPVHGEMSPEGRDRAAQTFRETEGPCCFVATIDSVGIAISLVGADLVLFGDLVAEPWKLLQAEKRGHRFDSKKSLLVRYLIATGTIDEGLAESVIDKLAVLDETLGGQVENTDLSKALGARTNEEIVDSLFARLKAWSGGGDGG